MRRYSVAGNNAPKNVTWIIAVILGALGIVGHFVILALATKLKGL
jgi:hypothetical protein